MVSLNSISDALKNLYLGPMRQDINMKADAFASKVLQTSDNIVGFKKIIRAAQIGANGGAGAGTETGSLPAAGENLYVQIESDIKNFYGSLSITDKMMKSATGASAGSFVNALQREIDGLTKACKWNLARMIYGNGSGKLMTCLANGTTSTTITAASGDSVAFLLPGLKVDLLNSAGTPYSGKTGMRVLDVDRKTNKIILDTTTVIVAGDFLTMQSSYNLELTGLGKIFETLSGSETLYGKSRASYAWLRPYLDASFGAMNEVSLQNVFNKIEDSYNVSLNHLNMGDTAFGHYQNMLKDRRTINDTLVLEGGQTALKFGVHPVVRNKWIPVGAIDILDTSLFSLDQIDDWSWIEGPTKGILNQVAGTPTYIASLAKYCDLMCVLPGGNARLMGVTAPV